MRAPLLAALLLLVLPAGCECSSPDEGACTSTTDCRADQLCIDGRCAPRVDAGGTDASADAPSSGEDASGPPCIDGACPGDARCVADRCVPYGPGDFDETCRRVPSPGPVLPQIQCAFEVVPDGDPRPDAVRALHTPLVADLGIGRSADRPSRPSIVYVADYGYVEGVPRVCDARGVLRILDGATCRSQGVSTEVELNSPVTPALGDLDGDGIPEIVAAATAGGLVAFRVASDGAITRLWSTTLADGSPDTWGISECQWGGVALYDLDDDGRPESIFEGAVWGPTGVRLTTLPGWAHVGTGTPIAIGDYDADGRVEAVAGNATWEFDPVARAFAIESGFSTATPAGHVAVADLGEFPAIAGDVPGGPEIVVAIGGTVYVRTLGGGTIDTIPTATIGGGPPTIADFDGDGVREFGVAFGGSYEVFDLAETDRRLWTQPSQDLSSARTGSSVFDFNADGRAEVVYGDECFVRVYDGTTGDVLFSQAHFSSTWTENPIVADVDGDGSAEMVMSSSSPCSPGYCPELDPIFAGLRCDGPDDCTSGTCDAGLCRCTTDAECGATYGCVAPIAGTAGAGNVCRAYHRDCVAGVRVYRDGRDRWASSRTIWNQHGYHVTNVDEDGTIPRTSVAMANWRDPMLNNYRQNVQGSLGPTPGPDLTIQSITAVCGGTETTDMRATLCNRGVVFLDVGIQVVFDQLGDGGRTRLCDLRTTEPVAPGECTTVSCTAPVPAQGVFQATADDEGLIGECTESNNAAESEANCLM